MRFFAFLRLIEISLIQVREFVVISEQWNKFVDYLYDVVFLRGMYLNVLKGGNCSITTHSFSLYIYITYYTSCSKTLELTDVITRVFFSF